VKFERATDTYTTQSDDSCDILGLCLHTRDTFFSHNVYSTRNTKRRGKKHMICMNVTAFSDERRELGRWSPRDANSDDDHRGTRTRTRFDTLTFLTIHVIRSGERTIIIIRCVIWHLTVTFTKYRTQMRHLNARLSGYTTYT